MSNNKLDKVIPVDNPLEPEKGGFLKAYKEHYEPAYGSNSRVPNMSTGELEPLPYNMGLKDIIPKLNIESGIQVDIPREELNSYGSEFRVISFQTAKNLGLELKYEDRVVLGAIRNSLAGRITTLAPYWKTYDGPEADNDFYLSEIMADSFNNKYFQAAIKHGFLISLNEIKDREFVDILDKVSQSLNKDHLPKFDDTKYEAQFNKLGNYIEYLNNINNNYLKHPVDYQYFQDSDRAQEAYSMRPKLATVPQDTPWTDLDKAPFAKLKGRMPLPSNFKSENDFLKAGAHLVTNNLLDKAHTDYQNGDTPAFKFHENDNSLMKKYGDTIKDIAGTMFAAQFGVPVTQNDINRYNVQVSEHSGKELDRVFNLAARVANYARDLDVSKVVAIDTNSPTANMWNFWKKDNTQLAIQLATPSLNDLCKQNNIAMNKDSIIKALNDFTSQKFNEVAQNKEPIKAALSQEQPINQALITNSISVPADKSKESQTKGVER